MAGAMNLDPQKMQAAALELKQTHMKRNEILGELAKGFKSLDYEGEQKEQVYKNLQALEKTSNEVLKEVKSTIEFMGENGANVGDILKGLHQADVVKVKTVSAKKRAKGLSTKGL